MIFHQFLSLQYSDKGRKSSDGFRLSLTDSRRYEKFVLFEVRSQFGRGGTRLGTKFKKPKFIEIYVCNSSTFQRFVQFLRIG